MPVAQTRQEETSLLEAPNRKPTGAATETQRAEERSRRMVMIVAAAGDVFIGAGAFRLSFASLSDLAHRSGLASDEAWVWPLIVDGLIVVATVAVVALHGHGPAATLYPWILLIAAAAVSVAANAIHALIAPDVSVPAVVAGCVGAVPPLVLLGATHLTVELIRWSAIPVSTTRVRTAHGSTTQPRSAKQRPERAASIAGQAAEMRRAGWSNRQIAQRLQVHPSTVGRWLNPLALSRTKLPVLIAEARGPYRTEQKDRTTPADAARRANG